MAGRLTVSTINDDTGVLATQNGMTGIAKAWVNFVGSSGTRNGSFNVSSVTRNGTGSYTVNFTTAMPNANYASIASNQQVGGNTNPNYVAYFVTNTTSNSTIVMNGSTGGVFDPTNVFASFFSS